MVEINKISFYINHSRDIALFADTFTKINSDLVVFLFNDLYKGFDSNKNEFKKIKSILKKDYPKYSKIKKISEIYKKKKYDLIISSGNLPSSKITFKSILKYFLKFFNKNLCVYENIFIEKEISKKAVWFTNNLDRNMKYFPISKWRNIFDIYLTSSKYEKVLIKKKFPKKKIFNIGYPRLDKKIDILSYKKSIIKEFNLDPKKKIIIYLPTLAKQNKEIIKEYIKELEHISNYFNLIVRPHPKDRDFSHYKHKSFKNSKLKLDLKDGRDTCGLMLISDLIITDGGSSIVEAIYLKKKLLFHSWKNKMNFRDLDNRLKDLNRIDNIISKKVPSLENLSKIEEIKNIIKDQKLQKKIEKLRNKYFLASSSFIASDVIKRYYTK